MSLDEIIKRADEQIKARKEHEPTIGQDRRQQPDRRVQNVPVEHDRRLADRRQMQDRRKSRRSAPQRGDFEDQKAYDRAYDNWSMARGF